VEAFTTHNSTRDFAAGGSGVSKRVHQLCIIITKAEEENNHEGNEGVDRQVDKIREHNKKRRRKFASQPESGGSSCQLSIMAQKYPKVQEEKF
jgi:hypothetical protein